jgi:hypothetical protein
MASDLEQQLGQLDELLGLLDASALRRAQEALENQIAELTERLEVTRQALVHAQIQRRRLARARLLLEESAPEGNGEVDPAFRPGDVDPAFRPGDVDPAFRPGDVDPAFRPASSPAAAPQRLPEITAPFVADRRLSEERRANGERREVQDRRKNEKTPPAA